MFADPITIPHEDGDIVLTKINDSEPYASEYFFRNATAETRLRIRHSKTKATATKPSKDRHNVEITQTVFASGEEPEYELKTYLVFEAPASKSALKLADGLADWLVLTVHASLDKLDNWES